MTCLMFESPTSELERQPRYNGLAPGGKSTRCKTCSVGNREDAAASGLLDLDGRASFLELAFDFVGLFLGHAFLDGLRRTFHEVLGFL